MGNTLTDTTKITRKPGAAEPVDVGPRVHAAPDPHHRAHTEHHLPSASENEAIDSAVARMVVEKGLATTAEVDRCTARQRRKGGRKPLSRFLLSEKFITQTQLDRLMEQIDAEGARKRIPGYSLLGKLGAGSAATVYKARQVNLDRLVAIKVLPPKSLGDDSAIAAFRAEARAAGQLNHPNIVQCFDVGQAGDVHYIVMEYVQGRTVHEIVKDQGAIPESESLDIIISVAEALKHAHDRGFIHRDVKPKNVILTGTELRIDAEDSRSENSGQPPFDLSRCIAKLADLGLARAMADRALAQAEAGRTLGTPYYISPEQVRGDVHIGPPSDIYSLGATFYFLLTGRPPFEGKDIDEVMQHHIHTPIVPPIDIRADISPGVSEVIEKMLAKSEVARYSDCGILLTELKAWRAYHVLRKGETTKR